MAKSPYAELPEPLKSNLPALFASYPDLCETSPSSWFVWTDGKSKEHISSVCHAAMCYDGNGWDDMITAVPKDDELSLEYLRMLIRGPFRSMSDLIKLDRVGKNYFLHIMSLGKWPANVLMNFCIASRIPIEFHFMLSNWYARCEKGFDPTLAWLLTYSYGTKFGEKKQFDYRSFDIAHPGHMWIDPASNWTNILYGTFERPSRAFKTHPHDARPTNVIWGKSKDYGRLMTMTDDEIASFYTRPIQVIEPPPPPPPKVVKKKQIYINPFAQPAPQPEQPPLGLVGQIQAMVAEDNFWAGVNNQPIELAPLNWALEVPVQNAPQPHLGPVHEPEDDFDDEPPEGWFDDDPD